MLRIIKEYII